LLNTNPSGMKDVLRRAVLVIGSDGKLAYRWDVPDPPRIPTADEILQGMRGTAALR
jgi:peroxiredoxin